MAKARAGDQDDPNAASAEGAEPMVLSDTGEAEPHPEAAAAGIQEVPYDIGGLPVARGADGGEEMAKIAVMQDDGQVAIALDGGPRAIFEVTGGTITVPARLAPRYVAAIPGARLQED